jgi:5'-methylthioadenosine phosphorylase
MTEPASVLLLIAVLLPPRALDALGLLVEERVVRTPFGDVGPLALRRTSSGQSLWVQPYSGLPTRTDPRATVYAARALGIQRLLTWDAGVGVNHALARGQTVVAVDAIDATRQQPGTFFKSAGFEGLVGLGESAESATFCPDATAALHAAFPEAPPAIIVGVDGPRRETAAEARAFRILGADIICPNVAPELFLARELGLCFAALVTVDAYSRDQLREALEGEVRTGLEITMARLPALALRLAEPHACHCAT